MVGVTWWRTGNKGGGSIYSLQFLRDRVKKFRSSDLEWYYISRWDKESRKMHFLRNLILLKAICSGKAMLLCSIELRWVFAHKVKWWGALIPFYLQIFTSSWSCFLLVRSGNRIRYHTEIPWGKSSLRDLKHFAVFTKEGRYHEGLHPTHVILLRRCVQSPNVSTTEFRFLSWVFYSTGQHMKHRRKVGSMFLSEFRKKYWLKRILVFKLEFVSGQIRLTLGSGIPSVVFLADRSQACLKMFTDRCSQSSCFLCMVRIILIKFIRNFCVCICLCAYNTYICPVRGMFFNVTAFSLWKASHVG